MDPYSSPRWRALAPLTVSDVAYDPQEMKLTVGLDFSWRKSSEADLRKQIEAEYRWAGKPVDPDALSITKLQPVAYQLLLDDGEEQVLVYSTDRERDMVAQTVVFTLPMTDKSKGLHAKLSKNPRAVLMVLRAGYAWERLSGLTVERRALSTAWEKVCEKLFSPEVKAAGSLLVNQDSEQLLRKLMAQEFRTAIKAFGLTPAEEAEKIAQALDMISRSKLVPLTIPELLQLDCTLRDFLTLERRKPPRK